MSLICKIAGHKWHKTPDGEDGCACARCGERNYGGEHDWRKQPGSCESRCSWCGREETRHEWNGCTCAWCGEVRDFGHEWRHVPGTCDLECVVCGRVNEYEKSHEWEGCTCTRCGEHRNEGHDFALAGDGKLVCSVCGISADESRMKAANEMLMKARLSFRRDEEALKKALIKKACDLIRQFDDPAYVAAVAPDAPFCAIERLAELGADKELADIARSDGDTYSYNMKSKAKSLIKDASLRDAIDVRRTGMEAVWYDYDIKSGM